MRRAAAGGTRRFGHRRIGFSPGNAAGCGQATENPVDAKRFSAALQARSEQDLAEAGKDLAETARNLRIDSNCTEFTACLLNRDR
jgi:head-tail adaptor